MDPYLEEPSLWPDFHGAMLYGIRATLNAVLPERYVASINRHVWLRESDVDTRDRLGTPDMFIVDQSGVIAGAPRSITAPAVVTLPVVRREGDRYLRIIDRQNRRVVTVIELLSPSNKDTSLDREDYLHKRNEYLATGTNLVEIDLLRAGERLPLGEPPPVPADYYILVSRAVDFPRAGVWPFSVRDSFPISAVPLGPGEDPVPLDLKPCLDRAYDEARYAAELDYTRPPTPPLREPDATWARDLLAARSPQSAQTNQLRGE